MTRFRRTIFIATLFGFAYLYRLPLASFAENLSVSFSVGLASFTVSGFTCPSCVVSVIENSAVVGTTQASVDGSFSKTLSAVDAGEHTYYVQSVDTFGLNSAAVQYDVNLSFGQQYSVGNILLSPSLRSDHNTAPIGEDIHIQGWTYPNAQVAFYFDNRLDSTHTASDTGYWEALVSTTNRSTGIYIMYAYASTSSSIESGASRVLTVTLQASTTSPTPTPSSTPTLSPSPAASSSPSSSTNPGHSSPKPRQSPPGLNKPSPTLAPTDFKTNVESSSSPGSSTSSSSKISISQISTPLVIFWSSLPSPIRFILIITFSLIPLLIIIRILIKLFR